MVNRKSALTDWFTVRWNTFDQDEIWPKSSLKSILHKCEKLPTVLCFTPGSVCVGTAHSTKRSTFGSPRHLNTYCATLKTRHGSPKVVVQPCTRSVFVCVCMCVVERERVKEKHQDGSWGRGILNKSKMADSCRSGEDRVRIRSGSGKGLVRIGLGSGSGQGQVRIHQGLIQQYLIRPWCDIDLWGSPSGLLSSNLLMRLISSLSLKPQWDLHEFCSHLLFPRNPSRAHRPGSHRQYVDKHQPIGFIPAGYWQAANLPSSLTLLLPSSLPLFLLSLPTSELKLAPASNHNRFPSLQL